MLLPLVCFTESKAQFLAGFSALQNGTIIQLDFSIAGGNTCNGIRILRSADGIQFAPIGSIAGICGSSTEDVFYSFTDPDPIRNADNYYRLDLITLGYSHVLPVHFIYFGDNEFLLYPNPVINTSMVYLKTTNADVSSYRINDSFGRLLKQADGIRGNYFELNRENWPAGIYFLQVNTGTTKAFVKLFLVD